MIESVIVPAYRAWSAIDTLLPMAGDDGKKNPTTPPPAPGGVKVIDPNGFEPPPGMSEKLGQIISVGTWIVLALCVAGVLMCAAQMAVARKNGGESAVVGLVWAMAACVIAGTASGIVKIVA